MSLSPVTVNAWKRYQDAQEAFMQHKEFCMSLDPDNWPRLVDQKYYGEMVARRADFDYCMGLERSNPALLDELEASENAAAIREEVRG